MSSPTLMQSMCLYIYSPYLAPVFRGKTIIGVFGFFFLIKLEILFKGSIEKVLRSFPLAMLAHVSNICITWAPAFICPIACAAIALSNNLKSCVNFFLFFLKKASILK